jgi:predicted DNA-binding protein
MKKNTVKLTESKLKQIIRESIENYIKENEDIDWGEL